MAERAASTDPLADFAGPLVYDGYLDAFRPADLFSGDPLDLEAIAVWEEENGVPWDPLCMIRRRTAPIQTPTEPRGADINSINLGTREEYALLLKI